MDLQKKREDLEKQFQVLREKEELFERSSKEVKEELLRIQGEYRLLVEFEKDASSQLPVTEPVLENVPKK